MVVLQGNMLGTWSKFRTLRHFNTAAIVLPDCTEEFELGFLHRQEGFDLTHEIDEW